MQITHVIRGVEWSASTPLHYDIYSAFNWTPPQFAHVGLLVDQNQAKLSKRNQDLALDVASMRDTHGVLPETLTNFLALLGWSNPTNNDVMDMQSLIENFDLKFTRGNAMVRMEKLWFLQRRHVAELCASAMEEQSFEPMKDLVARIVKEVCERYPEFTRTTEHTSGQEARVDKLTTYCAAILLADSSNYQNAAQWVNRNRYFFTFDASQIPHEKENHTSDKTIGPAELRECGQQLMQVLDEPAKDDSPGQPLDLVSILSGSTFEEEQRMRELLTMAVGERKDLIKPMASFLREKIAMGLPGPSIYLVMALLGPEECSRRLRLALMMTRVVVDSTLSIILVC
jgi:glutamyl-tRNA synthetase